MPYVPRPVQVEVTRAMMRMTGVAIGLALALQATSALGQSNPRYVQFRPSATKAALYAPDSGPAPAVAFLAIHRTSNLMNTISTREFTQLRLLGAWHESALGQQRGDRQFRGH